MMRESELQALIDERDYLRDQLAELTGSNLDTLHNLTRSQSRIVRALDRAQGRMLNYDALMNALTWDYVGKDAPAPDIISVHISRIRKKRPDLGFRIKTVRGEGYRMVPIKIEG